jgi:hypothetical protein
MKDLRVASRNFMLLAWHSDMMTKLTPALEQEVFFVPGNATVFKSSPTSKIRK